MKYLYLFNKFYLIRSKYGIKNYNSRDNNDKFKIKIKTYNLYFISYQLFIMKILNIPINEIIIIITNASFS